MTTYAKFTEHNEWEAETWHSWIPIEGNELALKELATTLDVHDTESNEEDVPFELSLTPVPGSEVDAVVKHANGDTDYMAAHSKLAGRLVIPSEVMSELKSGEPEGEEPFYKGGIRDFMKESK